MRLSKWILAGLLMSSIAVAAETGSPAPDFTAKDSKGESVKLSSLRGKTVVLEWLNHGCPFVKKHYDSGNMQELQAYAKDQKVVWLSVISSAKGKQGTVSPAQAEKDRKEHNSSAAHVILDSDGKLGKLYAAKTTPHMYVINPEGKLVYQGAIDDKASTDKADVKEARNYVREAIWALIQKPAKPIEVAETKSYGCSVKY